MLSRRSGSQSRKRPGASFSGSERCSIMRISRAGAAKRRRFDRCERACLVNLRKRTIRSEEHTSELQSLMRISYAVFCLKKKKKHTHTTTMNHHEEKKQAIAEHT